MTLRLNSDTYRAPSGHTFAHAVEMHRKNSNFDVCAGRLQNHLDAGWNDAPTESLMFPQSIRKATLLEERTRIAQELHDTLLQTFLSASMQLGVALDSLPSNSPAKSRLDRILQLMDQGIEEARSTIQGLRSSDSPALDLVLAFSHVQQELGVHPEVAFSVIVSGRQQPLRPSVGHEAYRIGREALVNAFRHSRAKCVELELEYSDTDLCMRVRDNGCGIDPQVLDSGRQAHWGLTGMRERATRIGGLLKISSSATSGTEVQLSIPGGIAFQHSRPDHTSWRAPAPSRFVVGDITTAGSALIATTDTNLSPILSSNCFASSPLI